jgi:hypothetical protein
VETRALVELADVLADLGCMVAVVPPCQMAAVEAALQPAIDAGEVGPAVLIDSTLPVVRRRAVLSEAMDDLLDL